MVKIPATRPGLPAIRAMIAEGININITLLFSQQVYAEVAEAYLAGLESLVAKGGDAHRVASVASFFVSRIDTLVDEELEKKIAAATNPVEKARLQGLKGKVAIANAKLAYQLYKKLFSGERWRRLAQHGAQTQRLLWASTGTKNKAYRDVLYVEELIGPETISTIPPATMDAFRERPAAPEPGGGCSRRTGGDERIATARHLDRCSDRQACRRRGTALHRGRRPALRRSAKATVKHPVNARSNWKARV
jgi:transaldolase/glucose-6-phosphate isomerase